MTPSLMFRIRKFHLYCQTVLALRALSDHLLADMGIERDAIEQFAWDSLRPAAQQPPHRQKNGPSPVWRRPAHAGRDRMGD